jgi:hypothetical protein
MPSEIAKKALDMGLLTQKQYDKLPPALLDAIAKKKISMKKVGKKNGNKNKNNKK